MANITKRTKKTTLEQYKYYVDFLCGNDALRNNKNSPVNPNAIKEAYESLSMGLNSLGGPERTPNAWKKVFADWKSQTKKKARLINNSRLRTGGGPSSSTELSQIEERLLDTIGRIVIDGGPNVPEAGINVMSTENLEEVPVIIAEEPHLEETDVIVQPLTIINETSQETRENNETSKKYKTTTEKVTDAYRTAQEEKRKLFLSINSELKEIKESLAGIAQAIKFAANVELAKARAKYPHIDIQVTND